jgi:hypothetical protein
MYYFKVIVDCVSITKFKTYNNGILSLDSNIIRLEAACPATSNLIM